MEVLRDEYGVLEPKDGFGAVASIIGAATCVIEYDGFFWYAQLEGIGMHGSWFVIVNKTIVTAHEDFFNLAREEELGCGSNPVTQDRCRGAITPQAGAKDNGSAPRGHIFYGVEAGDGMQGSDQAGNEEQQYAKGDQAEEDTGNNLDHPPEHEGDFTICIPHPWPLPWGEGRVCSP